MNEEQSEPHTETLLDVRHMTCPLPVLKANRTLRSLPPGARLRVLATDPATVADFKAFCQESGHALLACGESDSVFSFTIRRRAEDPAEPSNPDSTVRGPAK